MLVKIGDQLLLQVNYPSSCKFSEYQRAKKEQLRIKLTEQKYGKIIFYFLLNMQTWIIVDKKATLRWLDCILLLLRPDSNIETILIILKDLNKPNQV